MYNRQINILAFKKWDFEIFKRQKGDKVLHLG